jgi:dATP pyrophosphohydrolase
MPRAPFQVLVLPYRKMPDTWEFAVFRRSDSPCWQGIAGGGEDDETPMAAAKREAFEEAGIPGACRFTPLQATCTIPVTFFQDNGTWDPSLYVIPEHSFGVDCTDQTLVLSNEHGAIEWLSYTNAHIRFTYDSNRTALWELHLRLQEQGPRDGLGSVSRG